MMNVQGHPEIIDFEKEGELNIYPRKLERTTIETDILLREYEHGGNN